jgi:hypothetical protein
MGQDAQGRYYSDNESSSVASLASATKTATGTGTAFATPQIDNLNATLVISAASGTNPTLDLTLETTADGTNYYTVGTFPQQTTTQAGIARVIGPLGSSCRWKWTLAGTSPSFTFAVTTTVSRDD